MHASRSFLSLVLSLAAVLAAGQQNAAAGPVGRAACIFPLVELSTREVVADSGTRVDASSARVDEAERAHSLFSVISADIGRAGFRLIPEPGWLATPEGSGLKGRDFLDLAKVIPAARAAGADMAVSGFFSIQEGRIVFSLSLYEVATTDLMAGFLKTWRYNLGIYSSLHAEVRNLTSHLSFAVPASSSSPGKAPPVPVLLPAVTFTSAQEGMEVLLPGGRSIGRISGGKLMLDAPGIRQGEALILEKRLAGYHTGWQRVQSAPVVALSPLARTAQLGVEAVWTVGQLVGAGAAFRYYIVPDSIFGSLSIYPYAQLPASPWGNLIVHTDAEISAGSYLFFPPESLFRLGASAGVGLIFSRAVAGGANLPSYWDSYLNVLSFWAELNLAGISFFLRPEVKLSLGVTSPNLLGRTVILAGTVFPPVTLGALLKW